MSKRMYRQGDLLFVELDAAGRPQPAQLLPDGVLAYGEATGHAHVLEASEQARAFVDELNQMLIEAETEAKVVHPEHGVLTLEPGVYRVVRQREQDAEQIRYVSD